MCCLSTLQHYHVVISCFLESTDRLPRRDAPDSWMSVRVFPSSVSRDLVGTDLPGGPEK